MLENLLVIAIVAVVLALVIRSLYRTITGKGSGCGCGKQACANTGTTSRDRPDDPTGGVANPPAECRAGGCRGSCGATPGPAPRRPSQVI
jgi:hypothetical protein